MVFKQATMGNYLMFLVIPKQWHVKTKSYTLYLVYRTELSLISLFGASTIPCIIIHLHH
mgnify:FL=1